jgi:hypothetical protein
MEALSLVEGVDKTRLGFHHGWRGHRRGRLGWLRGSLADAFSFRLDGRFGFLFNLDIPNSAAAALFNLLLLVLLRRLVRWLGAIVFLLLRYAVLVAGGVVVIGISTVPALRLQA